LPSSAGGRHREGVRSGPAYLGLTPNGASLVTQITGSLAGDADANDYSGPSLTTSDFNCDGYADLAAAARANIDGRMGSFVREFRVLSRVA
jgi:hypothetical protein